MIDDATKLREFDGMLADCLARAAGGGIDRDSITEAVNRLARGEKIRAIARAMNLPPSTLNHQLAAAVAFIQARFPDQWAAWLKANRKRIRKAAPSPATTPPAI